MRLAKALGRRLKNVSRQATHGLLTPSESTQEDVRGVIIDRFKGTFDHELDPRMK